MEKAREEKNMEEGLRKSTVLIGTWLKLGDGLRWCIPPMPLGRNGLEILELLEKYFALEEEREKAQSERVRETMARTRKIFEVVAELTLTVLRLNYPKLPQEYYDNSNLVNMQHVERFISILQGEGAAAEIIEAAQGEAEKPAAIQSCRLDTSCDG